MGDVLDEVEEEFSLTQWEYVVEDEQQRMTTRQAFSTGVPHGREAVLPAPTPPSAI